MNTHMTSRTHIVSHTTAPSDHEDFDARTRRIRGKILDGIEETLDQLAQPHVSRTAIGREEILSEAQRAVRTHCAALLCRRVRCRRSKRCCGTPCAVPESAYGLAKGTQSEGRR